MKIYSARRGDEGVFRELLPAQSDGTFDMRDNSTKVPQAHAEPWRVTLIETGEETQIGGASSASCRTSGNDDAFSVTFETGEVGVVEALAKNTQSRRA